MRSMMENHSLFLSVFICIGGVVIAAWEILPQVCVYSVYDMCIVMVRYIAVKCTKYIVFLV